MAHEITSIDKQQGTFQAWHGLTEIIENLSLRNNWLRQWDVTPRKMTLIDGTETPYSMLVASDNPSIQIGVPFADSYTPITNAMFLDTLGESILGIDGLNLDSVGSVCGRGKIFASFKIAEGNRTIGGRTFETYLNFGSSHDKSAPFWFNTSNICTVCANTFGMNLTAEKSKDGLAGKVRHTKNAAIGLGNVAGIIEKAMGAQAEFNAIFSALDSMPASEETANRAFAGFIGKGEEMSTRSANQVDRLTALFNTGKGNRGETMADVFSAVTDFYSHESSGGDDRMKQFVSSEFGSGAEKKSEFFSLLADGTNRQTLIAKGVNSLKLTALAN